MDVVLVDAEEGKEEEVAVVVVVAAARLTNFNCESVWCVPRLKRGAPAALCRVLPPGTQASCASSGRRLEHLCGSSPDSVRRSFHLARACLFVRPGWAVLVCLFVQDGSWLMVCYERCS